MRKFFLPLLCAIMLGGCAKHGGLTTNFILENKELTALKGRHILDMQKYIDRWAKIEIGTLSNKYYLQYDPQVLLSQNKSCNFYGCWVTGNNFSTYGYIYFTTDKDGYVTNYSEDGDDIKIVKHIFKDLLILEN